MQYVAFLRAVNVGGRMVKMDALRQIFTELGYTNVRSYIQTGNLLFERNAAPEAEIEAEIEQALSERVGFEIPAIVLPWVELESLVRSQPFRQVEVGEDLRFAVTFTRGSLVGKIESKFPTARGDLDLLEVGDRYALFVWKLLDGKPPAFPMTRLEKQHGIVATSRFFGMLEKMVDFANQA